MRSIEVEGDDIDQAIANALRALQVERDRVEVEILSAATRGVLGFGGRKARIRATVRPPLEVPRASSEGAERAPTEPASVPRETTGEPPGAPPDERRRGTAAEGTSSNSPAATARAKRFLEELLERLETSCSVEARGDRDDTVVLTVSGPETGLVIGRRGQTLDALEYLVNRVVAREDELAATPRFVVDAEGYRARRQGYLEDLAARLCDKVSKTQRPVTLNPMTPRDRRIVHLAVQKHIGLTSRSQGEGHLRPMMILPQGRERRPARGSGRGAD